jgi:peptidoglycan/xylan/chitin deacetylase (PgdA/CDA1 family)
MRTFQGTPTSRPLAIVVMVVALVVLGVALEMDASGATHRAASGRVSARALVPGVRRIFPRQPGSVGAGAVSRVLARTPLVSSGGRRGRLIALTFDDGPGPYTWPIVRELRRLHVPATFFEVGRMMSEYPGAVRLVRQWFPVGDHTLSHAPLGLLGWRRQRDEIDAQAARLEDFGASRPRLFRPPYASFDAATLRLLRSERMLMVLWSVDSRDYTLPGARQIVRNVVGAARPGAIVLMHDAGGPRAQTAAALPAIVRRLRARGYRFATVPQLLALAPPAGRQKLPPGAGEH